MLAVSGLAGLGTVAGACVPNGPPAGDDRKRAVASEQKRNRAVGAAALPKLRVGRDDPPIVAPFEDHFDREEIGAAYRVRGDAWVLRDGRLCGEHARNRGVWLARRLPANARIEFDAQSASPDGDLKAEFWGDGVSGATTDTYSNASSYLAILGGWKNTLHVLARLDEHGLDRRVVRLSADSEDDRERPISPEEVYRFRVERSDGRTVLFSVNGVRIATFEDPAPLVGEGHDHVGFNDWDVPVCFDNLTITPL
jgi:hypothetical protein